MNPPVQSEREHSSDVDGVKIIEVPHRVVSTDLLRGKRRLIIEHGEKTYVLLLTRNGKLILNKSAPFETNDGPP